jgi:hypothetical protein
MCGVRRKEKPRGREEDGEIEEEEMGIIVILKFRRYFF